MIFRCLYSPAALTAPTFSMRIAIQPTPKVNVADTVGAGDSFTGAFVASVFKGASVEEAHRKVVAVSAFVCTQNGAMPAVPAELL